MNCVMEQHAKDPNFDPLKRLKEISHQLSPPDDDIARKAVELIADGLLIVSSNGKIFYISALTYDLFGYSRGELLGVTVEELIPDNYRPGHVEKRTSFLKEGLVRRMSDGVVVKGLKKDGSILDLQIALSPISWNGGLGTLVVIKKV